MTRAQILSMVDHTLLKADCTWEQIKTLCDEAVANKTASICINPGFVAQAAAYLDGAVPVCTVIGFPLGATSTQSKVAEAKQALLDGAKEFDMVINISALKDKKYDLVKNEIAAIKEAVGDHVLKVIIETCLLCEEEKEKMCQLVIDGGADYIKTSTGFSTGGATFEDIALFKKCVGDQIKIKAAGGISSVEDMERFIQLGANRLGTSSAIKIFNNTNTGDSY